MHRVIEKRAAQNWLWITPLAVMVVLFARPRTLSSLAASTDEILDVVGTGLIALGIWIRICARGWKAQAPSRTLVTEGLYSYIRHPLYVASFAIGLGIMPALNSVPLLTAFVVIFLLAHIPVIRREEISLRTRFGEEHERYTREVRALIPSLHSLKLRRPIVPRPLLRAAQLEADAILLWGLISIGLDVREDFAALLKGSHHIEVMVWCAGAAMLVGLWTYLKATRKNARFVSIEQSAEEPG
ncbi:MAG: isoprenylcysteine carboxylmethyltransferase family protein [Armatimonadetes bacterium]|nr:isoprenylcysteine carboxylmethyltransferase family protein [Armatimonadota bacterium]